MQKNLISFFALVSVIAPFTDSVAQQPLLSNKSITAVRTEIVPTLDGKLDETLWATAAIVRDLHEVSPNEYEEPSEETVFYVVYGKDALYIGAEFTDKEPENVVAKVMRQGDFSEGEDGLKIILDTFNNGRKRFRFSTDTKRDSW